MVDPPPTHTHFPPPPHLQQRQAKRVRVGAHAAAAATEPFVLGREVVPGAHRLPALAPAAAPGPGGKAAAAAAAAGGVVLGGEADVAELGVVVTVKEYVGRLRGGRAGGGTGLLGYRGGTEGWRRDIPYT